MRIVPCLALVAAAAAPAVANANCYSVYDAQNRLAYQSNVAPIDLSMRIADAMRARFPSSYLVMVPDESRCSEVRADATVQPRAVAFGVAPAATAADRAMQAPLLRNSRSGYSAVSNGGGSDVSGREAVRSGTNLNLRRDAASPRP